MGGFLLYLCTKKEAVLIIRELYRKTSKQRQLRGARAEVYLALLSILSEKKKNIRTINTFLNENKFSVTYTYNFTVFMC